MDESARLSLLAEGDLVERYRATRDDRLFEELYRRERRRVFAICRRFVRDDATAEDLCQEAFVRAYERFDTFEGTVFGSWVSGIAAHLSLNVLRSRRMVAEKTPVQQVGSAAEAERLVIAREEIDLAFEILSSLSTDQRSALLLRHLDGLGHEEIASRIGCAEAAVRSILQNARRNFRIAWQRRTGSPATESR